MKQYSQFRFFLTPILALRCLVILFIGSYTVTYASVPPQYMILDLQFTTSLFADQANSWTATNAKSPTTLYSSCNAIYLLGGYNILFANSTLAREYYGLPPHQSVSITFSAWFIDDWELTNYLYVSVWNSTYMFYENDFSQLEYSSYKSASSDICGSANKHDLGNLMISLQTIHSGTSLKLSIEQMQTDTSLLYPGQLGIRDVKILLSNKTIDTKEIVYMDNYNIYFTNFSSVCLSTEYLLSPTPPNCKTCSSSCGSCSDSSPLSCWSCADTYTYNGTYCNKCSSSCLTCFGGNSSQCSTCSEGLYLYPNSTCKAACSGIYVPRKYGGFRYCDLTCSGSNYLYYNGSCLSTCSLPFWSSQASLGGKLCQFPCNSTNFLYQNGSCLTTCQNFFTNINDGGFHFCQYPCLPSEYLYWNGSCLSKCSIPLIDTTVSGNLFCSYPCTGNQYLYWDGTCADSCASPLVSDNSTDKQFCNYPCTTSQYLYWDGSCQTSCISPLTSSTANSRKFCSYSCTISQFLYWDGICAASCNSPLTATVKNSRNFCTYSCVISQYLYWDGTCQLTCAFPLTVLATHSRNICNYGCLASQYLYWDGSCNSACTFPLIPSTVSSKKFCSYPCTTSQYLYWDGTCNAACSFPLTNSISNSRSYCNYPCTSSQYLYWDGACSATCSSPLTSSIANGKNFCSYPCTTSQYLYWDGTCNAACSSPLVSSVINSRNFCSHPCTTSQYLYWDGSCEATCSFPLTTSISNSRSYCSYPCTPSQYLYWDGACSATCSSPLTSSIAIGKNFCNYPCATSQYLYWDGTCVSTCDLPLSSSTANSRNFCKYPCTSSQYLYYNATCDTSCSSPLSSRVTGGLNYCDYPCTSSQYLYWDATCHSTCAAPLVSATISSKQFCYYPCSISHYLYWNGSCLPNCSPPLVSNILSNDKFCNFPCNTVQYLYWNGTCANSCTSPLVSDNSTDKRFCKYPCNAAQYLYWNGSCLSDCPFPLTNVTISSSQFCSFSCSKTQYHYWNGTCMNSCMAPLVQSAEATTLYCNLPCLSSEFLYPNGSCFPSCPSPLVQTLNNSVYTCHSPCTDPNIYYNTSDQSCQSSCSYPYAFIQNGVYISCFLNGNVSQPAQNDTEISVDATTQAIAAVGNVVGNVSGVCITATTLISASDPTSASSAMLAKMLQYTKFINITKSRRLSFFFKSSKMSSGFLTFIHPMSANLRGRFRERILPAEFLKYKVHSSFLVNFWEGFLSFSIICGIYLPIRGLEWIAKYLNKSPKLQKGLQMIRFPIQNFLIIQFYNSFSDIVLFSLLNMKTLDFQTGTDTVSFLFALSSLIFGFCLFIYHYRLLRSYQMKRSTKDENDESRTNLTHFVDSNKGFHALFFIFDDTSLLNQSFLLIFTLRTILYNIIIATLYNHPLIQAILIMVLSLLMLGFMILKRPFKLFVNLLQHVIGELILFSVNMSIIVLAGLDMGGHNTESVRDRQGHYFIICSMIMSFLAPMFIGIKISLLLVNHLVKKQKEKRSKQIGASPDESSMKIHVEDLNELDNVNQTNNGRLNQTQLNCIINDESHVVNKFKDSRVENLTQNHLLNMDDSMTFRDRAIEDVGNEGMRLSKQPRSLFKQDFHPEVEESNEFEEPKLKRRMNHFNLNGSHVNTIHISRNNNTTPQLLTLSTTNEQINL